MTHSEPKDAPWWKSGVLYQVYPRSFQDSDGDGVGDLNGIASRLEYLADLGIAGVWISPIYESPMVDFGYDITDHTKIHALFGTLDDFHRLVEKAHGLGLKIILDFVPCHTSDQHEWFLDSRRGHDAEKRDWYIWRDPAPDGGPPNNWQSEFSGPAWTYDPASGQYYYHAHLVEQPELNWRNPEVRAAQLDIMRIWFERGVDGFRIDAIDQIGKDERLRDNPPNPEWHDGRPSSEKYLRTMQKSGPFVQTCIAEMRELADAMGGRLLAGEAYQPIEKLMPYYGTPEKPGLHMPYNFSLVRAPWDPKTIATYADAYEAQLPEHAWPNWVMGNHDVPRIASHWGRTEARLAAMMQLTLRGTPTIYQGEELGMESVPIPADKVQDPAEHYAPGHGKGRDPVRTPIAWEGGEGCGFTTGEPWLPIDDRDEMIGANQSADPASSLALYRKLLQLRRTDRVLALGDYRTMEDDKRLFVYERSLGDDRRVIALNFSEEAVELPVSGDVLCSTHMDDVWPDGILRPLEGRILTDPG